MCSASVNLNCDVNVNELLREVPGSVKATNYQSRYFDNGHGRFVSVMDGSTVVSATYHDSAWHTATAQGAMSRMSKSEAPPGQWAITYTKQGFFGNRTFYNWN